MGGGVRVTSMKTLNAFAQLVVLVSLPLLLGGYGKKENITEVLESVTATKLIEPTLEIEKNGLTSLIRLIIQ